VRVTGIVLALLLTADAPQGPDGAPGALAFRGRLEWITSGAGALPRDTPVNPENRVLLVPQAAASSELRPDLRLELGKELQGIVRPRLLVEAQRPYAGGTWQPERSDARAEWIELYGSWRLDDRLAVAYGLQNFQWGPAELVSPSNRIFHETGFARDPLYVVYGKHLARVNVSFGREWSAVVLAEVRPNAAAPFIAGEPFDPKGQSKLEWSATNGRGYAAVTAGAGARSRGFFGEYASASITDGWSIYADAVHQMGSRAWYPVIDGAGEAAFAHTATGRGLRTLALGGIRYTFEGGADARLEYLFDETGWTDAQLALASRAASTSSAGIPPAQAVSAWLAPGFEILGRQHAYVSLRIPDLPPAKRAVLQLRYLAALEDGSGALFGTVSYAATDSIVLFASAAGTYGSEHGALSRLAAATGAAGAIVNW
jgi:hypothetical protein